MILTERWHLIHFFSESVKEALNLNHLQQCSEFPRIDPLTREQLLIFHMVKHTFVVSLYFMEGMIIYMSYKTSILNLENLT